MSAVVLYPQKVLSHLAMLPWPQQVAIFVGGVGLIWAVHRVCSKKRKNDSQLRDKVVCITGATGGLGSGTFQVVLRHADQSLNCFLS